jgi:hypothetical protein
MKMPLVAFALGIFALGILVLGMSVQGARASEPNCRTIESAGERLACYDAVYPLKARKPVTGINDASRAVYKDPFAVEDARTTAILKNICRGC